MGFDIRNRVAAGIGTPRLSGFNSARNLYTPLPNVPLGPIVGISNPPMASGGAGGASSKAGTSNPNKSSSLSDSGEINADTLDEEGGDLDKIKELEEELKKKEATQKAEEKRLNEEEEKLKQKENEIKANKDIDEKKKAEELQKVNDEKAKLGEDKKKLEEEQKITTEQRKQLDEVIAPPFAEKDTESGKIIKDKDGSIQFLEKKSPELEKLKQLIRDKDPETIDKVRKALEEFNDYRKKYPAPKEDDSYTPITPQLGSRTTQRDLITNPPSQLAASAMFDTSSIV